MKSRVVVLYSIVAFIIVLDQFLFHESDFLKSIDYKIYDELAKRVHNKEHKLNGHVIVVDIDEKSLQEVGQWPWPRVLLAKISATLHKANASVIGYDILFPEDDRTSPKEIQKFYKENFNIGSVEIKLPPILLDNDKLFANTLNKINSVGGYYLTNNSENTNRNCTLQTLSYDFAPLTLPQFQNHLCNISTIQNSFLHTGFLNSFSDSDGILRSMPLFAKYHDKVVPSFALATLLSLDPLKQISPTEYQILGKKLQCNEEGKILLHFYDEKEYKKISAVDLLQGRVDPALFRGKIVLIGSSALALHDKIFTTGFQQITGVHVHVTVIENLLGEDYFIQPLNYKNIMSLLSLIVTFLLFYFLIKKFNISIVVLFLVSTILSYVVAMFMLYQGIYISIGYFFIPYIFHFFFVSFLYILIEAYERYHFNIELGKTQMALLDSMVYVAEVHDTETGAHIVRTKLYVKALGEYLLEKGLFPNELTKEKVDIFYNTAPLHDIGKVGIPDAVLKKPGKLTPEEFKVIQSHPEIGAQIIDNAVESYHENLFFKSARNIALYHHEKWDGSGYPRGLKGEEIPLESRLMALADVFDALISRRVYKEAFEYEKIRNIIIEGRGKHFDPIIVDAFLAIEDKFLAIAKQYQDEKPQ